MLRYLGRSRQGRGRLRSGTYDARATWTVTDHDAHAWVEVWFRGYGWLPFDPTPAAAGVAGAYSASSPAFNLAAAAAILAGKDGLRRSPTRRVGPRLPGHADGVLGTDIRLSARPGGAVTLTDGHSSAAPSLLRLLVAAARCAGRPDRGWQARAAAGRATSRAIRADSPPPAAASCRLPRRPADRASRRARRCTSWPPSPQNELGVDGRRGRHARDRRALRAARWTRRAAARELRELRAPAAPRACDRSSRSGSAHAGCVSLRSLGFS